MYAQLYFGCNKPLLFVKKCSGTLKVFRFRSEIKTTSPAVAVVTHGLTDWQHPPQDTSTVISHTAIETLTGVISHLQIAVSCPPCAIKTTLKGITFLLCQLRIIHEVTTCLHKHTGQSSSHTVHMEIRPHRFLAESDVEQTKHIIM